MVPAAMYGKALLRAFITSVLVLLACAQIAIADDSTWEAQPPVTEAPLLAEAPPAIDPTFLPEAAWGAEAVWMTGSPLADAWALGDAWAPSNDAEPADDPPVDDPPADSPTAGAVTDESPGADSLAADPLAAGALTAESLLADPLTVTALTAESLLADPLAAPQIVASGQTLSWTAAVPASSYVFVQKVPNALPRYSIVTGTSITPSPVPGQTVRYSVRANLSGSLWAPEVSITYPAERTPAPKLTVSGQTLSWTSSVPATSYVLARKVPDQTPSYSIVSGTSTTPAPVAGQTVRYSVRVNVAGSLWAPEVSIAYPAPAPEPAPEPEPEPAPEPVPAPKLAVSGQTLSWTSSVPATSYVLARKVPDQTPSYSIVSGTSTTPAPVAGQTVRYSVRVNVAGSLWAPEVSIAYPAAPAPAPSPTPTPVDGSFQMGVVAGSALSYELGFIRQLGARTARLEFGIGTSASSMASVIDQYARAGIRPLLLASFHGRNPSSTEAQNLGGWAAAYGPGGTFWQGKSYPANTAVTHIEFGNETSYSYQFADNSLATYSTRAQTYAQRARDAAAAIRAANPNVRLLAIADNAVNGSAWVVNMFRAVPSLGDLVGGWTIHPYGPNWATRIDSTVNSTRTAGSRDLPIWITEWGLSTDNGRCLDDNYGWNRCMTYGEAATTLRNVLTGTESRYGSRLGAFFLYQAHDQSSTGASTGRERYFGALQDNGTVKGAYTTEAKAHLAANP
jgi:hypothetical protein